MQQPKWMWLGFATLGLIALGCNDDGGGDDEVGESSGDSTSSTGDESSDHTEATSESTTEATDGSMDTDATDTADTNDTNDTTTGEDGFTLIEAAFANEFGTLVLTFNEAVAPVDAVDPADFRISVALSSSYTEIGTLYEMSYYSDPNIYFADNPMPIGMMAIANGPNPDQISLTLDPEFDMGNCAALESVLAAAPPEIMAEGHFFPHYAPGNVPVTSESGVELPPIGPDWVLEPDAEAYIEIEQTGWPNLHPQVPIPCP